MNSNLKLPIAILGGTFDPVHLGHLRLSLEILEQLQLDHLRFIPCKQPVLKAGAMVTHQHRLAMLQLALADESRIHIDTRELDRATLSYMVPTLESLRRDFPNHPLCLIMGVDALMGLERWHRWQEIFSLCHLLVVNRPEYFMELNTELASECQLRFIKDARMLQQQAAGYIYLTNTTPLAISSTQIRMEISVGKSVKYLVPDNVLEYIQQYQLYKWL